MRRNRLLLLAFLAIQLRSTAPLGAQSCNLAPIAVDDTAGHLGAPLTVDVLANDQEPDGEPLSLEILSVSAPCQNDQVVADHGHVRLTPNPPGTPKNCTVTYRVSDERGAADTAILNLVAEGILFWDGFESGDISRWSTER